MALKIQSKNFEAATPAALETAVNTYLQTLDPKDVLDVITHAFSSSKYGMTKTYTATVVYLADIV